MVDFLISDLVRAFSDGDVCDILIGEQSPLSDGMVEIPESLGCILSGGADLWGTHVRGRAIRSLNFSLSSLPN